MKSLKITYVATDELAVSPRNSRTHSKAQVALLAKSIREFGWTNPILTDGANNVIAGAGRLAAAKQLGESKVPTIALADLTPAQRKAYMIADNKIALHAGWDDDILGQEMQELIDLGFDIELTGFDQREVDMLLDDEEERAPEEKNLSKVDALLSDPSIVVEKGDVWQVGDHVLYCTEVVTGWSQWVGALTEGSLLCVYPGPFVAVSKKASEHRLVMIQPDPYVAGHILDTFKRIHKKAPKKLA
jgi:hypothetical protein